MGLDVGMDLHFWWLRLQQSLKLFVCCKLFSLVSQNLQTPMMPKMFAVLALLAHGAVSVRSGSWHLELDTAEKKPHFVEEIFKKGTSFKGWFARKLGKKKIDEFDEELVDEVQKALQSEEFKKYTRSKSCINVTRHQVKEFMRTASPSLTHYGWTWTSLLRYPIEPAAKLWSFAKLYLPLDVSASAVAFCGELVKAAKERRGKELREDIKEELRGDPEKICSEVLTGNLSNMSSAPKWAVKAAQVAEMDNQQHPFGRLDGVAWKHSLKRVCHDECHELVQGIQDNASELSHSARVGKGTIEDACADEVVKHVEAEILGCCSKSCGWNGQFCSFFPFLSSKEQTAWQSECCSERNILNGSTRQQLCDSTLSQADKINSQKIVDKRPNTEENREIIGQDESPASDSWSLMERSFDGPVENRCPQHINLHNIYSELFQKDWKRMPSGLVEMDRRKRNSKNCKKRQESRGACKAFLLDDIKVDQNEKTFKKYVYICWDACGLTPAANFTPELLESLAHHVKNPDPNLGTIGVLFVHKDIYNSTEWNIVPELTSP